MTKKTITISILSLCIGLISCNQNSDDNMQKENQSSSLNEVKARSSMSYQNYYIGRDGVSDGYYNDEKMDCSAKGGEGCIQMDWTIDKDGSPIDVEFHSFIRSIDELSTVKAFSNHLILVKEIFDAAVVEGALENFFEVKYDFNPKSLTYYFKIKRIHDGVVVGVKPVKVK